MSCDPRIEGPPVFPRKPENRPALRTVAYRVGAYGEFREAMLRSINEAVALRAWTHRGPDDPGIALLEGAAVLGDILTFYQEHYANEAFLRTASWRESVASLTRLLGYRLAPGLGGRATFAFEVKGAKPVQIPAGLPIKADLAQMPDPVDFETAAELTAYPQLSQMRLSLARSYANAIPAGATRIEIADVGGSAAPGALDRLGLKPGDRLMLVAPEPPWTTSPHPTAGTQQTADVIEVVAVTRRLGRTILDLKAPLAASWPARATAYRLGRTFRHFGHLAPPLATNSALSWLRRVYPGMHGDETPRVALRGEEFPLDREVHDLLVGGRVVIQADVGNFVDALGALTAVKRITAVRAMTIGWSSFTGPSTMLTLDSPLFSQAHTKPPQPDERSPLTDIRFCVIHEVTSPKISLLPQAAEQATPAPTGGPQVCFFGTRSRAAKLSDRRLLLTHADGRCIELRCITPASAFDGRDRFEGQEQLWKLAFDRPLPFDAVDFSESAPRVTAFGNVTDATQGKAEAEVVLGNGDGASRFQTFKLPKAPLTYLLSDGVSPPQAPELDVLVNGRRWAHVDSLFGRLAADEIYIVREDADGASYVQFGDGETGARLPSGVQNVSARYRSGSGARGPAKPGADPAAGRRIDGLANVRLPGVVSGGADPEPTHSARRAAPGRVQSLGRLVSVADFETETLSIPGVTTATAAWDLVDGVPALVLRVLLEAGREGEFADVRKAIQRSGRRRGPDRIVVDVRPAALRYALLDLVYACDPRLAPAGVEAALRTALGLAGDEAADRTGLFGLHRRRLGAPEYATRIEATCQQVAGVAWCTVAGLDMFAAVQTDPATLQAPAPHACLEQIAPEPHELLALDARQLTLTSAPPPAAREDL